MEPRTLISEARLGSGLTQAQLAARAGTSQTAISAYENGSREPSLDTLRRLLAAAGARLTVVRDENVGPREPSRAELTRAGRTLMQVLELAEALPVRHERELRFPRLKTR